MDGRRPVVSSLHGMVAAAHPLAAQAGARLLGQGGNAFDAAVGVAAALNVAEPASSGLAGMGVATCWIAAEGRGRVLDFTGRVPLEFPVGRFSDRDSMHRGAFACGMPTNLAGWCELHGRYGRLPLTQVFAPAIALATDGVPLLDYGAQAIAFAAEDLRHQQYFADWAGIFGRPTCDGHEGTLLRQPDLAATLATIAETGPAHLYDGPLGRALIERLANLGGCISQRDLARVAPGWRDPAIARYRDLCIHAPPPPLEAFQYLLTLRILDGFNLAALPRNGVTHLDLVWRAIRLAAGLRIRFNKPEPDRLDALFADAHIATLRARVADDQPIEGPPSSGSSLLPSIRRARIPPPSAPPTATATSSASLRASASAMAAASLCPAPAWC